MEVQREKRKRKKETKWSRERDTWVGGEWDGDQVDEKSHQQATVRGEGGIIFDCMNKLYFLCFNLH